MITPGIRILLSGSATSFQTSHSCSWRTLAASNAYDWALICTSKSIMCRSSMSFTCGRCGLAQQKWKRINSSGQSVEGVVDHLDAHAEICAQIRQRPVGIELPARRELGLVDLDDQAGVGDRSVLLADGLRHGHQVGLLIAVVLVAQSGANAQRTQRRQKSVDGFALERGLQVLDVLGNRRLADVLHRSAAHPNAGRAPVVGCRAS